MTMRMPCGRLRPHVAAEADPPTGARTAVEPATRTAATPRAKPHVLVLIDHLGYGEGALHGLSSYLLTVLPGMEQARWRITLAVLGGHHPVERRFIARGITPRVLGRGKWNPGILGDLVRLIRREAVDLVVPCNVKGMLLGGIAARLTGRALLPHLHDTFEPSPPILLLQRRALSGAAGVIAVSEPVRAWACARLGLPPERVTVLPNAVDLARFRNPAPKARERLRAELGLAEDTPVAAIVGRFDTAKGHDLMLRAFARLRRGLPEAVLLVIGGGPELRSYEAKAAALGLGPGSGPGGGAAVRFLGQRDDMPELLQAIDVVAAPSLAEGFGLVPLEAAAAGRAVVATRVGAIPEIVADGVTGLLVPPGEIEPLVAALADLLGDRARAAGMGAAAAARAADYSLPRHCERLAAAWLNAIAGGAGRASSVAVT